MEKVYTYFSGQVGVLQVVLRRWWEGVWLKDVWRGLE